MTTTSAHPLPAAPGQDPATPEPVSTAEAYLVELRRNGVDRLFVNAGTDFATIVEAYSRRDRSGLDLPDVVLCGHENLAISMAHGAYLATGRPQAVMVHTSVGTANAVCGLFSAARARVPLLLTAGRTPLFETGPLGARNAGIHWGQELYDQGGMVRELVKWDYELRDGQQVGDVVGRALDIALTEPRGPVYLTLPREVLARPTTFPAFRERRATPTAAAPAPAAVATLADRLVAAALPVIVTSSSGADPATVAQLAELCDRYAIGVVEREPRHVNVPADHPLHLGYDVAALFDDADVLCFLDVDVPWIPRVAEPRDSTFIAQCGPDPHFLGYPMRSHRTDLSITSQSGALLAALTEALEQCRGRIDPGRRAMVAGRAALRAARRPKLTGSDGDAIDKAFLNQALRQVRDADTIVVDEYWCSPEVLGATRPGTYVGSPPAGALGWGLPAALGMALGSPDRTVIATVGDGAYLFANPAVCHHAMAMHGLPVLVVVATNGVWGAVDGSTKGMYPHGDLVARGGVSEFARLDPVPAFELYAQASGGLGRRVTERAELVPALEEALRWVRQERRHALVNVICR